MKLQHLPFPENARITDQDRRFAADWAFAYDLLAQGKLNDMRGKFVGVYERQIVGAGDSEREVRSHFVESIHGQADDLIVLWVDEHDIR